MRLAATFAALFVGFSLIWPFGQAKFTAEAQNYLIQIGDQLDVSVLEDPNLNRLALVRPDGRISLPIAGSVRAAGRTTDSLERVITERLRDSFAIMPNVTVAVAQLAEPNPEEPPETLTVYVIGEVNRPGVVELEQGTTLLQALALSGGLSRFAATRRIQLRRVEPKSGEEDLFIFDYRAVERGAFLNSVVEMRDGDVIVVPERRLFE